MKLQERIFLLSRLGEYILSADTAWQQIKEKSGRENKWFIPEFVDLACKNIADSFLRKDILEKWIESYGTDIISSANSRQKPHTIGLVMAGNIPLVGFHDMLCIFMSGNNALIKLSSKDQVLIKHLVSKMTEWSLDTPHAAEMKASIEFAGMLKNCDAYIATGSNNSSRYFEYYFGKYPHIIRRNKTSAAIITGDETSDDLDKLADDVYLYFGLGCRNVTKIYVPSNYDFIPLLSAFKKYNYLAEHHQYKNNYDYNLTLHLLNKKYYMSNDSILLIEEPSLFSPISQLNYEFYINKEELTKTLQMRDDLQCIVGRGFIPFGRSQSPSIIDYADGIDTLRFLMKL